VKCRKQAIEVTIDHRIIDEQKKTNDSRLVYFKNFPQCLADRIDGDYHWKIETPFTACGMILEVSLQRGRTNNVLTLVRSNFFSLFLIFSDTEDFVRSQHRLSLKPVVTSAKRVRVDLSDEG